MRALIAASASIASPSSRRASHSSSPESVREATHFGMSLIRGPIGDWSRSPGQTDLKPS